MRYVLHFSIRKKNWHIWNIFRRTSFEHLSKNSRREGPQRYPEETICQRAKRKKERKGTLRSATRWSDLIFRRILVEKN